MAHMQVHLKSNTTKTSLQREKNTCMNHNKKLYSRPLMFYNEVDCAGFSLLQRFSVASRGLALVISRKKKNLSNGLIGSLMEYVKDILATTNAKQSTSALKSKGTFHNK